MVGVGGASTGLDHHAWELLGTTKKHGLRQDLSPEIHYQRLNLPPGPWFARGQGKIAWKITERLLGGILGDVWIDQLEFLQEA